MKQIDIDTGHTLLTLTMEDSKRGLLITAYVNNISVRSSAIQFARVADTFVKATMCACAFPCDRFSEPDRVRVSDEICEFIDGLLNQEQN